VGREIRLTVHQGGSWVPSLQIFMPRSLLANRLHDTWRNMPEQIGSALWLGLGFTFHPPVFSALVTYLPLTVFVKLQQCEACCPGQDIA